MNKNLFQSASTKPVAADTKNEAGGLAYSYTPKHALAQLACTGCLTGTFYASAEDQLTKVKELIAKINDPLFLARLAVYSRESAFMKDMPAILCAAIFGQRSLQAYELLKRIFPKVINNGKMLRNFVQAVRSGQFGRKSLGTVGKRLVQSKITNSTYDWLLRASVGNDPSLKDLVLMAHPKAKDKTQEAFFAWILGQALQPHQSEALPEIVKQLEAFKLALLTKELATVPDVPHELLTALKLRPEDWKQIFRNGGWHFTRMNLNTALRQKVFEDKDMIGLIADRLRNKDEIQKAKVFPYQLLAAYLNRDDGVPRPIVDALHDAVEAATENVPATTGHVIICVDVSGSMSSPITGNRGGGTSQMRCVDIASMIASTILRKNSSAEVLAFDTAVYDPKLEARDSILTNAARLATYGGGGTNCSAPLALANSKGLKADAVVFISDNESWCDRGFFGNSNATGTMQEWIRFRSRNPKAKMIRIDLQPYVTTQVSNDRQEVLNIGGFSDNVFTVISTFLAEDTAADAWLKKIESIEV